jgi:ketosteroid isomerase-like protein
MKASVEGYFDAVARGDRERLRTLLTPDLRWRVPDGAVAPYAGLHEGVETILDLMLSAVSDAFVPGSQRTEILQWLYGENLVAIESELRAESTAGETYRNRYAFFFEFRDGRISEIREHVDTRYAANFFAGVRGNSQEFAGEIE